MMRAKLALQMATTRRIEERYVGGLKAVMRAVHKAYIDHIFGHSDSADDDYRKAVAAQAERRALRPLGHDFDQLGLSIKAALPRAVTGVFDPMAKDVQKGNATALKVIGITPTDAGIGPHIAAARDANIKLVENAARVYADDVRTVFNDPDNYGLSVADLKTKLLDRGNVSESRAELIARDQTLKLNGKMTQVRQQNAGVESYIWSTSRDDRVREEHADLEGEQFDWSSAPEPGHPGEDFQCRCVAIPYIEEFKDLANDETASAPEEEFTPQDSPDEPDVQTELPDAIIHTKAMDHPDVISPPEPVIKPTVKTPVAKPEPVIVAATRPPRVKAEPIKPPPKPVGNPLLAPPTKPVEQYGAVGTVYNDAEVPKKELHNLLQVIQPDVGHEKFLEDHPLQSIGVKENLKGGAHGMAYYWQNRLDVADDIGEFKAGEYKPGRSWIVAEGAQTPEQYKQQVLVHEFGHYIHLGGVDSQDLGRPVSYHSVSPLRQEIDQVVKDAYGSGPKDSKAFVSLYARTDHMEYFAESYTAYRYHPETLLSHDPIGHAMVEKVLKLRGIR